MLAKKALPLGLLSKGFLSHLVSYWLMPFFIGINLKAFLSGGQRARINLARALYSDANLYLLDDPLAAVDTKVVNHIYHNAISEELSKKTRILVTHHVSLLRNADKIICINNKARFRIYEYLLAQGRVLIGWPRHTDLIG